MTLSQRLMADLHAALRNRDEVRVSTIRLARAAIHNRPQPIGEAALRALVADAIRETGATSGREAGRVVGVVMRRVRGQADGKTVERLVREALGG
jgi:uncharacterized protein YqeY